MFTSDQNRCGRVRLYGPFRLTSSIADCIEIKSMCISSTHRNEFLMPNVYLFMLVCWWSSGVHTILMEQIKYAKHILWMTVSCGMYAIRDLMIFGLPHLFSSSSFFARIFIIYQPFLTMMMVSFLSLYFFFSWSIFCTIITVGKSTRHIHLALASLGSAGYHELNKYLLMHAHAHTLEEGNIFIFSNFEPFFVVYFFFPFPSPTETIFSS